MSTGGNSIIQSTELAAFSIDGGSGSEVTLAEVGVSENIFKIVQIRWFDVFYRDFPDEGRFLLYQQDPDGVGEISRDLTFAISPFVDPYDQATAYYYLQRKVGEDSFIKLFPGDRLVSKAPIGGFYSGRHRVTCGITTFI